MAQSPRRLPQIHTGWSPGIRRGFGDPGAGPTGAVQPPSQFDPPICLYGSVAVNPGAEAEVPTGYLSNNTGREIEIREIRLSADSQTNAMIFSNLGGVLRAMIAVNGKPVTAVPTPLWSLGRLENAVAQAKVIIPAAGYVAPASQYVWRLARPMRLPARSTVSVRFVHTGVVNFAITGRVALAGTYGSRKHTTSAIPYVLFWESKQVADVADTDTSDDAALSNKLGRTINVDRMILRHAVLNSMHAGDAAPDDLMFTDGRGLGYGTRSYGAVPGVLGMATVTLTNSRNWKIVDDAPPWDFVGMSGAIEVPHLLAPDEFYRMLVKFHVGNTLTGYVPTWNAKPPDTFQHGVHFSVVGSRDEVI